MVRMSVSVKKSPARVAICWRKGDPFQGPKLGSCLTLGNELSEETHVLTNVAEQFSWVPLPRCPFPIKINYSQMEKKIFNEKHDPINGSIIPNFLKIYFQH